MNERGKKVNNSYETSTTSSSSSSAKSESANVDLMLFPLIGEIEQNLGHYQQQFDYNNEYSSTPLVYSWLPIVPGFNNAGEIGSGNLHNFEHLTKCSDNLDHRNSDHRLEMLNETFSELENSCNAIDLDICTGSREYSNLTSDLSFNGKITELSSFNAGDETKSTIVINESNDEGLEKQKKDEEEEAKNESFELLKKEDSSKMLLLNEKSPDVAKNDNDELEDLKSINDEAITEKSDAFVSVKTLKERDTFIATKLKASLQEHRPPQSINSLPLALDEMLAIYHRNVDNFNLSKSTVSTNSLFIPSHSFNEMISCDWPKITEVNAHLIMYNRSSDCEDIEMMCNTFSERFIRPDTSSSFNYKTGHRNVKKQIERQKLLTQSPGSRLSHLAHRRKVLSSANLKTNSVRTDYKTFSNGNHLLIDKSQLYKKKKRVSAKKKTPGKRRTPKSAKRLQLVTKPETTSVANSKRALFTSPLGTNKNSTATTVTARDKSVKGPRRTLFSPPNKRKRSPTRDHDVENYVGKHGRRDSPAKIFSQSKSFSLAPLTHRNENHLANTLYYRTQSETVLNQSDANLQNLGFKRTMTFDEKRKLLWTVSSALSTKQIHTGHEKFKEFAAMLCKLVKKLLIEFYNPKKSLSGQMLKYSNLMVFYVVQQEKSFDEIYKMTRARLRSKNPQKVSGYIGLEEYARNNYVRKNSSLILMSNSKSSLNFSSCSDFDSNLEKSGSDSSFNLDNSCISDGDFKNTSLKSSENVLRENNRNENSGRKFLPSTSDSNLARLMSNTPSNLLKAKRQISF